MRASLEGVWFRALVAFKPDGCMCVCVHVDKGGLGVQWTASSHEDTSGPSKQRGMRWFHSMKDIPAVFFFYSLNKEVS